MASVPDSVRFPHYVRLYKVVEETSFSDGDEVVLYEGKCLVYGSDQMRTFKSDNVIKSDKAIDIPQIVKGAGGGGVMADIEDYNGSRKGMVVTSAYAGRYGKYEGTTVYLNIAHS